MKLSVLIPVYNEERYVGQVIRKVLASDTGDLDKELVVVDDGSADGTAARPVKPDSRWTSTSTVGLPRESSISLALMSRMVDISLLSVRGQWACRMHVLNFAWVD